ncbi:MAG: cache domain-containing protein [Candidatus Methanomethylophilaceae archaeon]|nr:cache domain-containing protein [Candidatus Methanomethylophilaceae archaeon]
MKSRHTLYFAVLAVAAILAAGCTGAQHPGVAAPAPVPASAEAGNSYTPPGAITTAQELVEFVAHAAAYAREHRREKATIAFNDRNGTFVAGGTYIFAVEYGGTVVADATEPGLWGTDISNLTDPFGIRFVERFEETARFDRGYVSYMYQNPANNDTFDHRIAVVEDVDGTYYVGAGLFAPQGRPIHQSR